MLKTVRNFLPKHMVAETSGYSTKTWDKAENLQEFHTPHIGRTFPERDSKSLISGTLLFQGVRNPATTILPVA